MGRVTANGHIEFSGSPGNKGGELAFSNAKHTFMKLKVSEDDSKPSTSRESTSPRMIPHKDKYALFLLGTTVVIKFLG